MAIEEAELPLENQGVVLIVGENLDEGGSNGSAKSTLFEAFSHTCTGTTAKGMRKNELLNLKNPKNLFHELSFSKNNHDYIVRQYRAHSKFGNKIEVIKDGVDVTPVSSVKHRDIAQDYIMECIGFSPDEFTGSLYLSQEFNHAMISGTPKERGQYLSSYFGLSSLDTSITVVKKRMNGIQLPQEEELNKLKDSILQELEQAPSKESLELQLVDYENTQQVLLNKQTTLQFELEKQKKARDIVEKRASIEKTLEEVDISIEDDLSSLLAQGQRDLQEVNVAKKQLETKISLENRLLQFGSVEDLVDISYDSIKEDIEKLTLLLANNKEKLLSVKKKKELEKEFKALPERVFSLEPDTISSLLAEKEKDHKEKSTAFAIVKNELKKLLALKGKAVCPTCLQPIAEELYQKMVGDKSSGSTSLDQVVQSLSEEVTSLQNDVQLIEKCTELAATLEGLPEGDIEVIEASIVTYSEKLKYLSTLASKIVKISSIKDQLNVLPELSFTIEEVMELITSLEQKVKVLSVANTWILSHGNVTFDLNEMSRIQNGLNSVNSQHQLVIEDVVNCKGNITKIAQLNKQLVDISNILAKSKDDRNRIKVLESMHFVLDDLRKMKLKESTELLTTVLPENIKRLFPKGNVGIEVTSEAGEFDLYLIKNGMKIPMKNLSGGQKKRVGLAIVFAFAKMGSRTTNLLIADEIFKDLDPIGRKCAYELLMDLHMDTVLITSHDNDVTMRSKFDQVWTMRMENGKSRLYL